MKPTTATVEVELNIDTTAAVAALLAAADALRELGSKIHLAPAEGSPMLRCCGSTPWEVPTTDRMTLDSAAVTCPGDPNVQVYDHGSGACRPLDESETA